MGEVLSPVKAPKVGRLVWMCANGYGLSARRHPGCRPGDVWASVGYDDDLWEIAVVTEGEDQEDESEFVLAHTRLFEDTEVCEFADLPGWVERISALPKAQG